MTSASGPTDGELKRPSDGKTPEDIAFIQCVGSRDFKNNPYCSSVCCMHATKEAILAYEHHPGTKSTIFYMDLRAVGKRFQEYISRAKAEYNVTYIRARPGKIEVAPNGNPIIWYEDTTTGETKKFETELVILCQALVPSRSTEELAKVLFEKACERAARKKELPALSDMYFDALHEGQAAQIMHIGPYAAEGPTVERVHRFI